MRVITAARLQAVLDYPSLIDGIDDAFRDRIEVPARYHHTVPVDGEAEGTLLVMPAWRRGDFLGVKVVTVFPGNRQRDLPSVMGSYLLLGGATGEPLALIDGPELTARRTAAASALASRYLSRADSRRLLMVGTGVLAPHLVRAHASARPIREVAIWGRTAANAERLARELDGGDMRVSAVSDLEVAAGVADVISCATLATTPLIAGAWLRPGQHLDLVGGFRPDMREADDGAVKRATVFVDTRAGALEEAGDMVDPIGRGVITEEDVLGDLFDLARGRHPGRGGDDEITLFKSVGTALEDLAGARLAYERTAEDGAGE